LENANPNQIPNHDSAQQQALTELSHDDGLEEEDEIDGNLDGDGNEYCLINTQNVDDDTMDAKEDVNVDDLNEIEHELDMIASELEHNLLRKKQNNARS